MYLPQITTLSPKQPTNQTRPSGGGRVVRRCWVNFQCRSALLIWIIVGPGPIVLAVGADGGRLGIFFSNLSLLFFSPSQPDRVGWLVVLGLTAI